MDTLGAYWRLCHIGNNYSAREVIRFLVLLNYCWMRRRICFSRLFASRAAKTFNFKVSVILGGLAFGFAHGYSHFMIQGGTITDILSELGGGIVGALVFSAIYEKSNSIGWPILIHAYLDFAGYLI